jgi:peptidoglycan/LPS O-acetylase OafA/YrhL
VTWSLAIEEQFYLTLPILVRFLSPRGLLQGLIAIALAAPVLRTWAFYFLPHGGVAAYVLTPMRADALLVGVLAAIAVRSPRAWEILVRRRRSIKACVGVLWAGAFCAMLLRHTDHESAVMSTVGYSWIALLYGLVVLLALSAPSGRLSWLLRARSLRSLGEVAYGTYLLHVPMLGMVFGFFLSREPRIASPGELGVTLVALALTIAVAKLSWTFFEKRMVRIGQRYTYGEPSGARRAEAPRGAS